MFDVFKRKTVVLREETAQEVCDLLFPKPTEETEDGITYVIDRSIDVSLYAALVDLEEGNNDEVTRSTIKSVLHKLYEVREVLQAKHAITKKARYLMVDAPQVSPIEDRVSSKG